jgi:DNA-binding response OmpR family regulator
VVLDIMLRGGNGLDLCRKIRDSENEKLANTPILMLTALASQSDKLAGFSVGADDYLTKPFDPRELDARLKALLKRTKPLSSNEKKIIQTGALQLDPNTYLATYKGKVISLKPQEFDLLFALAQNPGHVFSRQNLLEQVWGYSYAVDSRTVDIHVSRLRQKLRKVSGDADRLIRTVYGVGYKWEDVS